MNKVLTTFIELDCLLDTRIGVMSAVFPDWATRMAANPDYFRRIDDQFNKLDKLFPQIDYADTYAARTTDHIWGHSYMTSLVKILVNQSRALKVENVPLPEEYKYNLIVNLYPYKLDTEQKGALKSALMDKIACDNISLVSFLPEVITPSYLANKVQSLIMYDFDTWIGIHMKALIANPLPEVEVIHPVIVKMDMGVPIPLAVAQIKDRFRGVIKLNPLPLDRFSFTI